MARFVLRMAATANIIALCIVLILISLPSGCTAPALLKVGTLPVIDSLPLSLALYKPIFAENKLTVEVICFKDPSELRSALVKGEVDAVITDLIGALLINKEGQQRGKIVRVALRSSPLGPMFAIVAAQRHSMSLENAAIAISNEASHKYVAGGLLSAAGVARWTEIEVSSPDTGLEMVQNGDVAAALLPEPLVSLAVANGAKIILDDASLLLGQTVVVFNQRMVDTRPALIRRFLRAYEQSARELNVRAEQYRSLVVGLLRVPREVSARLTIPLFPFPGEVPTESEVESANDWLLGKKMVSQPVSYSRLVTAGFLWDPYQFRPAACCGW